MDSIILLHHFYRLQQGKCRCFTSGLLGAIKLCRIGEQAVQAHPVQCGVKYLMHFDSPQNSVDYSPKFPFNTSLLGLLQP